MKVDTSDQLQVLTRERGRLADKLEQEPGWRALKELAAREARGEWVDGAERAAERASLEAALAVDRIYLAWKKLGEVIDLLEPTTPAPLVASEPVVLPSPGSEGAVQAARGRQADDQPALPLMRIVGMDEDTARRLAGMGVTSLAEVAAWTAKDVKAIRKALGLGRRLSQQGWIEQAALLLKRDEADAAAVRAAAPAATPPATSIAPVDATASTAPSTAADGVLDGVSPASTTATVSPAPADSAVTTPPPAVRAPSSTKPASLTARLFARTPITGPQRSLLSAIEAAEQARLRPAPVASEASAEADFVFADPPPPAAAAEPIAEAPRSVTQLAPAVPGGAALSERPLVAPIDDEAEVAIVKRSSSGASSTRTPGPGPSHVPAGRDDALLSFDYEAQGGEDCDPRNLAAFRGSIEEASVEIVVRRPSRRAAAAKSGTKSEAGKP